MFLHIFLIPDSLILLKYWAPLIRIQEIRWPRPGGRAKRRRERERYKNSRDEQREGSTLDTANPHDKLLQKEEWIIFLSRLYIYISPQVCADLRKCTGTCAAGGQPPWPPLWRRYPCSAWPPAGRSPCSPHWPQWHNFLAWWGGSGNGNNAPWMMGKEQCVNSFSMFHSYLSISGVIIKCTLINFFIIIAQPKFSQWWYVKKLWSVLSFKTWSKTKSLI